MRSLPYLIIILVVIAIGGCGKFPLRVTCEPMDPDGCQANTVSFDSSLVGRKVLIIGVDGFRADVMQASISPFLFQLSQEPGVYFTDQNAIEDLTFSGPNWGSLVTGVHWCKHDICDNDYSDHNLDVTPHFFKYVEQARPELNTVSLVNWTPINEYSAIPHADLAPLEAANDLEIFEQAMDALENATPIDPDVLFLHFDELDGAGHGYGYSAHVPQYTSTLNTIDSYIAQLYSVVESKRADGEEWMVFVVTDHGGDGKGHGGGQNNEHIARSIFYVDCPELSFTSRISEQVDLVPTALEYLGIGSERFNCYKDGESLIED